MSNLHLTPPRGYRAPTELTALPPDTHLAVALSGGADSVALLHVLLATHKGSLCALHIHHGIRGEEADRDAAFCETLCEQWHVPLTVMHADVPALAARTGDGMETAARNARYAAFSEFLEERGIPLLATAHHADDQLETVLQHLMRGAGLRGLSGIPACRPLGKALVVRPLLQVPRADIVQYCESAGLSFVKDSTNDEPCCPRNRLRMEVLPVLRELWPSGAVCAARCAASLAEDEAFLWQTAEAFLQKEGTSPSCAALSALPTPVFARVMQQLLPAPPEATHVEALADLVRKARPHATLSLPHATVRVENARLVVDTEPCPPDEPFSVTLSEGETLFPCGVALLVRHGTPVDGARADLYRDHARIDFASNATSGALTLRTRLAGDRILSGGCHKAVRKLPCMSALTIAERQQLPLLCDENGLLAVPHGPVRDGARRDPDMTLHLFFN